MGVKKSPSAFNLSLPVTECTSIDRSDAATEPEWGMVKADPALVAEGWVRRHVVDPDRARESVELYRSMGYEVTVRPLIPEDFGPMCKECASAICRSLVLVYTRGTASR